jgi:hypothetical protein
MKWILALGFVAAFLVLSRGGDVGAMVQQSQQQIPQKTATSPELERRDQPATTEDLRILQRASELLKDESVWNRRDDRECDDDEATGKRSLFCALQKACMNAPRLSCRRSAANRLNHEWISRKTSHAV